MALTIAFVLTAATSPAFTWIARRVEIVDRPGPLKVQSRPVAYLGGLAVLAGLLTPVLQERPALVAPLAAATLLGLLDDIADLSARARFTVEIAIGVLVAWVVGAPAPAVAVVIVGTIVLINAVNLLDGLDGLASGVGLVSAGGFALVLDGQAQTLAAALTGALAGFLLWNRPPARIYLGDAGSYLIGTALAVLAATTLGDDGSVQTGAAAVLLLGIPVADTSVAITRRWRAGRPLLMGDRGHIYDQLVMRQWPASRAVIACVLAQVALAAVAVLVTELDAGSAVAVSAAFAVATGIWTLVTFTSPSSWT